MWPEGASEWLWDCFSCTDWTVFMDENTDIHTSSMLFYIKCCIDNVTTTKRVCMFPNSKPWRTKNLKLLLNAHNSAFRSSDMQQYSAARMNLKKGIRDAKAAYRRRIENLFGNSDPRWA